MFSRFSRYGEIGAVLLKYGFGDLAGRLHLDRPLELGRRLFRRDGKATHRLSRAERVRLAIEELGPTFIKFGQLLSTRPDVLPADLCDELAKLYESVRPIPKKQAWNALQAAFAQPPERVFREFQPAPLAAASIAQVHEAVLHDGTRVAVKLRRPGVVDLVERDLAILFHLAQLAQGRLPESEVYDPVGLVREFARTIRREMDFVREGRTLDRFRQQFADEPCLHVPRVYWEWTTPAVLTMEFVDGVRVCDHKALDAAGLDRKEIAARGARIFLGDPHPGNLRVLPGNVICLLDYGMVGRLSDTMKDRLADLIIGVVRHDVSALVELFVSIGEARAVLNREELNADVTDFLESYYGLPLERLPVSSVLRDFIAILSQHHIRYPSSLMLLARALITLESVGRGLDPQFNLAEHLVPFVDTLVRQRHAPHRVIGRMAADVLKTLDAARTVPLRVNDLIQRIEREQVQIPFVHRGLDRLISELDRSSNRICVGMVLAALIIASALIFQSDTGPQVFGRPLLGLAGFVLSGVLGFLLVIGIMRSGRL
jgi:ubiquinone biosynthesis protein